MNNKTKITSDENGRIALAISGGGFRAALFHIGTLWRLNEMGWLPRLHTITAVSGGSVTVGHLAVSWDKLEFDEGGRATNFEAVIADPLRRFCRRRIDAPAFLKGIFWPFHPTGYYLAKAYHRFLFDDASLQSIEHKEGAPHFIFLATSLQTGKSVRFSRDSLYDYTIGRLPSPDIPMATVVAASSAYPPLLSPLILKTDEQAWVDTKYMQEHDDLASFRSEMRLMDGGAYDNLGLEPIWKMGEDELEGHFDTVLVSDAGAPFVAKAKAKISRWAIFNRSRDVMVDQPRALRKRELIEHFMAEDAPYDGTYLGITTQIDNYQLDDAIVKDNPLTDSLRYASSRLSKVREKTQGHLINWGYALADAAMRKHVIKDHANIPAPAWPVPEYALDKDPKASKKKWPKRVWIPAAVVGVLLFLVVAAEGFIFYKSTWPNIPEYKPVEKLVYLDQGWTEKQRDYYYTTGQGAELFGIRYAWMASFEMPFGKKRLMRREYMSRLGFIFDEKLPVDKPDMPIGFASHEGDKGQGLMFDLTCAACHTGQFTYGDTTYRVNGGPGMHSFPSMQPDQFVATMTASLLNTWASPFKFNRFAKKVLGDDYPKGKGPLRRELRRSLGGIIGFAIDNAKLFPTEEGFGRTDALGRIGNTVFGDDLHNKKNYNIADAPVNYPHLWDIWLFDWVQWMGSVQQPMARNVNEALGVQARLDIFDKSGKLLPEDQRYKSTLQIDSIHCLEINLQKLGPPKWPTKAFGQPDPQKVALGEKLFSENCAACHGPHLTAVKDCTICHGPNSPVVKQDPHSSFEVVWKLTRQGLGDAPDPVGPPQAHNEGYWKMPHIHTDYIGTDITSAKNAINASYDLSSLKIPAGTWGIDDPTKVGWVQGLRYIGDQAKMKKFEELGITSPAEQEDYNGYLPDKPLLRHAYRPRPLEGIWATPPFLHNGSVPTIYDLLLPQEDRPSKFFLGRVDYDPRRLGLDTRPFKGAFELDTSVTGNGNFGHEFDDGLCGAGVIGARIPDMPGYCRSFKPDEINSLLEYLKVHSDEPYRVAAEPDKHCSAQLEGATP